MKNAPLEFTLPNVQSIFVIRFWKGPFIAVYTEKVVTQLNMISTTMYTDMLACVVNAPKKNG
jgi:hypothetical protein